MLEIAARGYLTGGRMGSMAGDSAADRLESYVWADQSLCGMGAGDDAPASPPWTGWHFTGTVLADVPGEMTVRVEWQRLWENGVRIQSGPSGAQTYRLRNGERVELDRVVPANAGRCGTVEAKLEAAVLPRAAFLMGARGRGVGVTGSGSTGARGGRGGARGGGTVGTGSTGTGSGTGGGVASGTARGSVGRGAGVTLGGTAGGRGAPGRGSQVRAVGISSPYEAEIWLVHKQPGGTESVQQMSGGFAGMPWKFSFPQVQVAGSAGPVLVDITGSLQLLNGPDSPLLVVSIARRARRAKPFLDTTGTTDVSMEVPKPDDVLSFELPPLQKSVEDLVKGHTFSIRLRMKPRG
jgi:hypothetical protein